MNLNETIEMLKTFNPLSIFLYGSQANNTTNSKSDYEIGVIFEDDKYVNRSVINKNISDQIYSIFPFKIGELRTYNIDTPFQKNIYIMSLISGNAKTIYGEKIIEVLTPPKITTTDLLMDTSFNLGYALSSVRVMKTGNVELANEIMYKSMFYATRNLIYFKTKQFIIGYKNIFEKAKQLDLPEEYQELLLTSYNLRNETIKEIDSSIYFKNISYINKYVIPILNKKN